MVALREPLPLRNLRGFLHEIEAEVLSNSVKTDLATDALNTVTNDCDLLQPPVLIREDFLDEVDTMIVIFELIKVVILQFPSPLPNLS